MEGSFHLIQYEQPVKEIRTARDIVTFRRCNETQLVADTVHTFGGNASYPYHACPLNLKDGEKAVVLKVSVTYAQNDFYEPAAFTLDECYGTIYIPPQSRCSLRDSIVYEPNLVNLGIPILPYIGMERQLLNASSTCISHKGVVNDCFAFHPTDPLLVFLLTHMHHFTSDVRSGDIRRVLPDAYLVRRHLVETVQRLFRDTILPLIRYTETPFLRFKVKDPPVRTNPIETQEPTLLFDIVIDYIVVSPGKLLSFKTK